MYSVVDFIKKLCFVDHIIVLIAYKQNTTCRGKMFECEYRNMTESRYIKLCIRYLNVRSIFYVMYKI